MTERRLAHSLEAEARQTMRQHAVPFHEARRREAWRLGRDLVLAAFAFAFLAVAYACWLAGGSPL